MTLWKKDTSATITIAGGVFEGAGDHKAFAVKTADNGSATSQTTISIKKDSLFNTTVEEEYLAEGLAIGKQINGNYYIVHQHNIVNDKAIAPTCGIEGVTIALFAKALPLNKKLFRQRASIPLLLMKPLHLLVPKQV